MTATAADKVRSIFDPPKKRDYRGPRQQEPAPAVERAPTSPRVEAAFLFTCMSADLASPTTLDELRKMPAEHMANPSNQHVLKVMQELAAEEVQIDPVIVVDRLEKTPAPVGGWEAYVCDTLPRLAAGAQARPADYAKILRDQWGLRAAERVAHEVSTAARTGGDVSEIVDRAKADLATISEAHGATSKIHAGTTYDITADVWRQLAEATERGKPIGVSWGIPQLDDKIGRMQQPGYIVIGGRSGQGKTQLAWQTCVTLGTRPTEKQAAEKALAEFDQKKYYECNATRTRREELCRDVKEASTMREGAYYGSFEMVRTALLRRGICTEANVPVKLLMSGRIPREPDPSKDGAQCPGCGIEYTGDQWVNLPTNQRNARVCRVCAAASRSVEAAPVPTALPSPFDRLAAAANLVGSAPVFIDDVKCTPSQLADRFKRVRDLAAEGKMLTRSGAPYPPTLIRTIVVDSIQDTPAPPGPSNRSRTVEIQDASKSLLDDVAKACNVTVIGLAKLGRTIDKQKDRRPTLADIRECGDIEYHADEIFFVHREQYYLRDKTPPEQRNIAEIIHGKGRNGLDLESPPSRLWFSGGMFFEAPPLGTPETSVEDRWRLWAQEHGIREDQR